MFYQLDEKDNVLNDMQINNKRNAGYKARIDVFDILCRLNVSTLKINYSPSKECCTNKISNIKNQIKQSKINTENFICSLNNLSKRDVLVLQYPLYYREIYTEKVFASLKEKEIKIIYIIHDIDLIRYSKGSFVRFKDVVKKNVGVPVLDEKIILSYGDYFIVHNDKMKKKMISYHLCNKNNAIPLGLFDYLIDNFHSPLCLTDEIMIAGNLSLDKAGYLRELPSDVNFALYGPNFDNSIIKDNINYYGSFDSNDLINNLNGKFGLVWDGNSSTSCSGLLGEYLKINNPHKTSLFLACGIPVITWKDAAISNFILKYKCGIVISSLNELKRTLSKIDDKEYSQLKENAQIVGEKIRNGYFLQTAFNSMKIKIESEEN